MASSENTQHLADAMYSNTDSPIQWQPGELAEMLVHQLRAPIRDDLEAVGDAFVGRFDELSSQNPAIRSLSFGALFTNPSPLAGLLQIVKEFAKKAMSSQNGSIPEELSAVLYYGSISCAALRCSQSISSLDRTALQHGLRWLLEQTWLDPTLRKLFTEHNQLLVSSNKA